MTKMAAVAPTVAAETDLATPVRAGRCPRAGAHTVPHLRPRPRGSGWAPAPRARGFQPATDDEPATDDAGPPLTTRVR